MINVEVYKNSSGDIYGFKAENHGDPVVCAAVSGLCINSVNSIEALTDERFVCEYDDDGGYLFFELTDIKSASGKSEALLLMRSLLLGLRHIDEYYGEEINLEIIEAVNAEPKGDNSL
jgi:uncharacterized protein YsxB (DUF464 family)